MRFPLIFQHGALWSDHPRWWQFFTNGFLSGNRIHLAFNLVAIWMVCDQFASQIRLSFLLFYFTLFSAASSFLFLTFVMPPHAWLVGASGGFYSLMGFFCWFLRRDRVALFGQRRLAASVPLYMGLLLSLEIFAARHWVPQLAWPLHLIAFFLSLSAALSIHAVYALSRRTASEGRALNLCQKVKNAARIPKSV